MSDYVKNLVARTLDPSTVVQPRLASRFEPHPVAPGTVTLFDVEPEGETPTIAPPFETRPTMRHPDTTTHAVHEPRIRVEHTPPPVAERRPDLSSNEEPPAPASERERDTSPPPQIFMNRETPKPTTVSVEAGKHSAREVSLTSVPDALQKPEPPPASAAAQAPRVEPRIVTPRLSPMPKVSDAYSQQSSVAESTRDEATPTIRVTIGRVDVRAVASTPKETKRAPAPPRPALTLEDYLRRRGGGSR